MESVQSALLYAKPLTLNWNQVWREGRGARGGQHHRDASHWNRRAPAFAEHTRASTYAENFLRYFLQRTPCQGGVSVLDVGCGPGTLAIPLAKVVRRVTAIDFSPVMIDALEHRAVEEQTTNIDSRIIGWEDNWDGAGITPHDIVIASRSLVVDDLQAALEKLIAKAREKVYVCSMAGDGAYDRKLFEAIGRELDRGPDYLCVYNLLHQMGILADIGFLSSGANDTVFPDLEDAVHGFAWMLGEISAEETRLLRRFLSRHLVRRGGGWGLVYRREVRWAVISWTV